MENEIIKQWEYKTLYSKFSGLTMEEMLCVWGKSGWELISVINDLSSGTHYVLFILKREITK